MTRNRVLTIAAAMCVLLLPATAAAQPARVLTNTVPVVIVMPPGASAEAGILVTRTARDGYRIILPRALATPENVRDAILTVSRLLDQDGDAHRDNRTFKVETGQSYTLGESPGAEALIEELTKLAGAGRGERQPPAIRIYLPGAEARAARRASRPDAR